jgi:hypothetical protein
MTMALHQRLRAPEAVENYDRHITGILEAYGIRKGDNGWEGNLITMMQPGLFDLLNYLATLQEETNNGVFTDPKTGDPV